MRLPSLAVVITTHDNPAGIAAVLRGLANQVGVESGSWEVVVVDNGSAQRVSGCVRQDELPFPCSVIEQPHTGEAWARNEGWRRTTAPVVAFLDDDLVPDPDFVAQHAGAHARNPGSVVLGSVVPEARRAGDAWTDYDRAKLQAKLARLGGREKPSGIHMGGNFSLPRPLLEQSGGFDNRLPNGDHVDLGFRLKGLGAEFVYEPRARVNQQGGLDFESWELRHRLQGRLDVAVFREREYAGGLKSLVACYHDRHPLNRVLLRVALQGRDIESLTVAGGRRFASIAYALHLRPLARHAMSVVANVVYWGGIRDGLRGNDAFWSLIKATRRHRGRPYEIAKRVGA